MLDLGKVYYKGVEYYLECDAWVSNKGTNGDVVYYAYAEREGRYFRIMWYTTLEYDLSCEMLGLEQTLESRYTDENEKQEIEERLEELKKQGIASFYCEDESNACDWDNADAVEEVD